MTRRRMGLVAGLLAAAVPGVLPAGPAGVAPAAAATQAGVSAALPGTAIQGRTHLPASLTVANGSTGAQATGNVTVRSITVVPSCGSPSGATCAAPDPGVLRLSDMTGAPGTACAGVGFVPVTLDATGRQRLDPDSPVVLGPPGGPQSSCRIDFEVDVPRSPSVDAAPATPGVQTATLVAATLRHADGTTATGTGAHLTTVTPVGMLRVVTSPAVPSQIVLDGVPADTWGVWATLPVGTHTVGFTDVEGYTSPPGQVVEVHAGATTTVTGAFVRRGSLRAQTSPALPATISVDGIPRDDWGMWTDLPAGPRQVCFGGVDGWAPPPCQSVDLAAGGLASVTGTFTESPGAPGPSGFGLLRVRTSPPVPSQILVDGVPRDSWGTWVKLAPGRHTVAFRHVPGYTAPAPVTVDVVAGATATVTGTFTVRAMLQVITEPAVPATVIVNGAVRDDWGMWTDVPAGNQRACFGAVAGYVSPPCIDLHVPGGSRGIVTGQFTPFP